MSGNPLTPTAKEVKYWFARANLITVACVAVLIFAGQFGISRLVAPLNPLAAKIQAVSEQTVRAQKITAIASDLAAAKRPGKLYTFRTELSRALTDFVASHRAIMYGDSARGMSAAMSATVEEISFDPTSGLDRYARDFVDQVRGDFLSDALSVDIELAEELARQHQQVLSPSLQRLSTQLSDEMGLGITTIYVAQIALLAIVAVCMLLLGKLLYGWISNRINTSFDQVRKQQSRSSFRFDEVTGLANRTHLITFMSDLCSFSREHKFRSAVLNIEVSGTEHVRTALAEEDYNEMMSMIARRIESICRAGDFLARVGEDEFVVVLTSLEEEGALTDVTNALRTKLSLPFVLDTHSFSLKTKIGIRVVEPDDQVPAKILNQAATALKISKASENYDIQFFRSDGPPRASGREREFVRIEKGLKEGEFTAFYQPIVDIKEGGCIGIEALVRWRHPKRGLLAPIHFIETVQNRGLSNEVTRLVLNDAFAALSVWSEENLQVPFVSVNIEPDQLVDRSFTDELKWIADNHDQNPSQIAFEIRPAALYGDNQAAVKANIAALSDYGFRLILDDFGTSGSDTPELAKLSIAQVKIKRAFVSNIDSETGQQKTIAKLIENAHALNLPVIAEGVETPAQRAMLQKLGSDALQGYLICEPTDQQTLKSWLARNARQEQLTANG